MSSTLIRRPPRSAVAIERSIVSSLKSNGNIDVEFLRCDYELDHARGDTVFISKCRCGSANPDYCTLSLRSIIIVFQAVLSFQHQDMPCLPIDAVNGTLACYGHGKCDIAKNSCSCQRWYTTRDHCRTDFFTYMEGRDLFYPIVGILFSLIIILFVSLEIWVDLKKRGVSAFRKLAVYAKFALWLFVFGTFSFSKLLSHSLQFVHFISFFG